MPATHPDPPALPGPTPRLPRCSSWKTDPVSAMALVDRILR
ncbi:MAG: hypothetical protein R3F44_03790 [Candidatus Competibacteraceae bacterium]